MQVWKPLILKSKPLWSLCEYTSLMLSMFLSPNDKIQLALTSVVHCWLAPLLSSVLTTSTCPSCAAIYSGVKPFWNKQASTEVWKQVSVCNNYCNHYIESNNFIGCSHIYSNSNYSLILNVSCKWSIHIHCIHVLSYLV